jgi:proline utilization trans-activator
MLCLDTRTNPLSIGRLGHSSSWSFSRRIRSLIHHTTGGELHDEIPIRDGAYGIPWTQNVIDLSEIDLPTEEYAEYLTNTFSLTLHPLYHLFDKAAFLVRLRQFYATSTAGMEESTDLWHIQMLIVFAFGYSILAREAGPSGPTGADYIARVVEAMPDNHRLHQTPIISIEILCMMALFMQAMDMRLAAYQYV